MNFISTISEKINKIDYIIDLIVRCDVKDLFYK